MEIKLPKSRAYYSASKNEIERIICWIPEENLKELVEQNQIDKDILTYFPFGLELEVSEENFKEYNLKLPVKPQEIKSIYLDLLQKNRLPESGIVDGVSLEKEAKNKASYRADPSRMLGYSAYGHRLSSIGKKLPEPEMTDGKEAKEIMSILNEKGV